MNVEEIDGVALWFAHLSGAPHLAHELEVQGLCDEDDSLGNARALAPVIEAAVEAAYKSVEQYRPGEDEGER